MMNVAASVALVVVLVCTVGVFGAPTKEITTPIPNGNFYGTVNIYPYSRSGNGYTCVSGCSSPVSAPARMLFYTNSAMLNITAASNGRCAVGNQGYYFYNLEQHSGGAYPYYYVGYVQVEGSVISVCLYFNQITGVLEIKLDGQGSCPADNDPAQCSQGWAAGTVTQVWNGLLRPSSVPSGNFFGNIQIVPYTSSGHGYTCTTCRPILSQASVLWNGDTFILSIQGASTPSCSLNTQAYQVTEVVEYGPSYPNYFYGLLNINNVQVPMCFYWDSYGNVIFKIDGQGSCPYTSEGSTCANSPTNPGSVVQTWVANLSISE